MRKGSGGFFWWVIAGFIVLSVVDGIRDDMQVQEILHQADLEAEPVDLSIDQSGEQFGYVTARGEQWRFTTSQLQENVANLPIARQHHFYTWSNYNQREMTGSASGVNQKPYFANSFLVGYKPFDTITVWEPLAILALRKGYILDHELYGPQMAEIWQNSRQAYAYTRGDCEDHALILADWLIAMGLKARVVLGKYKNGGHAWVVLFKDGKEYILEATTKRRPRSINDFQIAALATDYRPVYQFDRDHFWVNTGSEYTTRYNDKKWELRSLFTRRD